MRPYAVLCTQTASMTYAVLLHTPRQSERDNEHDDLGTTSLPKLCINSASTVNSPLRRGWTEEQHHRGGSLKAQQKDVSQTLLFDICFIL